MLVGLCRSTGALYDRCCKADIYRLFIFQRYSWRPLSFASASGTDELKK